MKQKANELMIGLFVTIATLTVIVGILWLGRSNFFVKGLQMTLVAQDAQGLDVGDQIFFRGLSMGTVRSADIVDGKVHFRLKLEHTAMIPRDSQFIIKDAGLLGGKAVFIESGHATEYFAMDDTASGDEGGGLSAILANSGAMQERLSQILDNINSMTADDSPAGLPATLKALNAGVKEFNALLQQNRRDINSLVQNLNELSEENKAPIHETVIAISQKAKALSNTIEHSERISVQLDSILAQLQQGRGSLGKLVYDESLYNNMNLSFAQLDSLLQDMRKNPGRYFEIKVF